MGVQDGYKGLAERKFRPIGRREVGGIIQMGGTILGTTRYEALKTPDGIGQAVAALREHEIFALVVIGGNGSQSGSRALHAQGVPVIGVASTIDNDLFGTDVSIGATTAVDVALESIDRLRVTAASMKRAFLVEVMGRHCGYLALMAGLAGGAEAISLPEEDVEPARIAQELCAAYDRGKSHAIAVISEGAKYNASAMIQYFHEHRERLGFELRATKLGHIQRGSAPGAFDRTMGTLLGVAAVEAVAERRFGVLVGMRAGESTCTPLEEVAGKTRPADARLRELATLLAM